MIAFDLSRLISGVRQRWLREDPTLPPASMATRRWGAVVAGVATLWVLLVACWGINGIFPDGHYAATAGIGVAGRNMWLWKTFYPILRTTETALGSPYYMHHPLGDFWVAALFLKIFGEHNWVVRLPAVIYTTLTPILFYRLGRAVWGPLAGGLAAFAYVGLPITLGFSNFHALEVPVIFGCVLATWGYARFVQTSLERYALASLFGFFWAVNHDWIAYVWGGVFVTWLFLRAYVLSPRVFGPLPLRSFGRYWGLMCGIAVASLVLIIALIVDSGKLQELLSMYSSRSSGNQAPMAAVLQSRQVWIRLMFPGLAIAIGKLAVPIIMARVVVKRNELELLPLPILIMAAVQYSHFKQGADIHIFWPQYFAPFFALAVGALTATLADLLRWLERRWTRRVGAWPAAPWLAAAVVALPLLSVFKDGAATIRFARETGGRYNSSMIQSDVDKVVAAQWYLTRARARPTDKVAFHTGLAHVHWAWSWELRSHVLVPNQPVGNAASASIARFFFLDSRYASSAELKQMASTFHVHAVGPYWFVDRAEPAGLLDGFSFDEREPRAWEWFIQGGTEPVRKVVPDPWMTWEWRTALDQNVDAPVGKPQTLEQIRVAHNVAATQKETARAAELRAVLLGRLSAPPTARYDNGAELLGIHHHRGAERSLTVYFLGAPFKGHAKFAINSRIDKRPWLSTLPFDKAELDLAHPPMIGTELWRKDFLYSVKFPYRKRPGTERFFGWFARLDASPAPSCVAGTPAPKPGNSTNPVAGAPATVDLIRLRDPF